MPEPDLYARACRHGWAFACGKASARGDAGRARRLCRAAAAALVVPALRVALAGQAPPGRSRDPERAGDRCRLRRGSRRAVLMGAGARPRQAFDNERWSPSAADGTVDVPTFYLAAPRSHGRRVRAPSRGDRWSPNRARWPRPPTSGGVRVVDRRPRLRRWLEATLEASPATPAGRSISAARGLAGDVADRGGVGEGGARRRRRAYPWGDEPRRDRANFEGPARRRSGHFACPECSVRLADMSGNVWEWTRSPTSRTPTMRPTIAPTRRRRAVGDARRRVRRSGAARAHDRARRGRTRRPAPVHRLPRRARPAVADPAGVGGCDAAAPFFTPALNLRRPGPIADACATRS